MLPGQVQITVMSVPLPHIPQEVAEMLRRLVAAITMELSVPKQEHAVRRNQVLITATVPVAIIPETILLLLPVPKILPEITAIAVPLPIQAAVIHPAAAVEAAASPAAAVIPAVAAAEAAAAEDKMHRNNVLTL